jgi:hypothetical protein
VKNHLTDARRKQIAEYISGEMETDQRIQFELELAQDEELSAEVESLLDLDFAMTRALRTESVPVVHISKWRRRAVWIRTGLAAAVVLIGVFAYSIFKGQGPDADAPDTDPSGQPIADGSPVEERDIEVARVHVRAGPRDLREFESRSLGSQSDLSQRLPESLRSEGATPSDLEAAKEFMALEEAFMWSADEALHGEAFQVAIETEAATSVLVLTLYDRKPRLYHPSAIDTVRFDGAEARIAAGKNVLPARRIEIEDSGTGPSVVFTGPFRLYRDQKRADILVVTRAEEFEQNEIDQWVESASGKDFAESKELEELLSNVFEGASIAKFTVVDE